MVRRAEQTGDAQPVPRRVTTGTAYSGRTGMARSGCAAKELYLPSYAVSGRQQMKESAAVPFLARLTRPRREPVRRTGPRAADAHASPTLSPGLGTPSSTPSLARSPAARGCPCAKP
jgi:hypothetical protein